MLTVVCFDLGGVLVRICRDWIEASSAAGFADRHTEALGSASARALRAPIMDAYQRGALSCDEYQCQMSAAMGGLYTPAEIQRVHDSWTQREYPGAFGLVDELRGLSGVVTACLSNTNHAHWQRLSGASEPKEYPTVAHLQRHAASHLLGLSKPVPEIYARAQEIFECKAEQVLFFDDLEENVRAARMAGWRAELVDHAGDTVSQMRAFLARHGVLAPPS